METEKLIYERKIEKPQGEGILRVTTTEDGKRNYDYDYPFAREIGKKIRIGEILIISEKTGLTQAYVGLVLAGKRYHESILNIAGKIIENREKLMNEEC